MKALTLSTCMAPNMDFLSEGLADLITARLSMPVRLRIDIPWQEREQLLDAREIDLCWICGLPYVWKADQVPGRIAPLAAPVMADGRYQNRPVYYSDVVVRKDSPFQTLADLRGATWAYNEPGSHSGYGVVRYALAVRGETPGFFGQWVESGAHQNSLRMIVRGTVDGSAIDSTVLALELRNHPELASQVRVIDTFGPSPIPPWVVSMKLPAEVRQSLRSLFLQMDQDPAGQALLQQAGMARFTAVDDADYDPIREMARVGLRDEETRE